MDNTLLESIFHWLSKNMVKFKFNVGVCKKLAKM